MLLLRRRRLVLAGRRHLSSSLKASPTVQKLIRQSGLEGVGWMPSMMEGGGWSVMECDGPTLTDGECWREWAGGSVMECDGPTLTDGV